MRIYIDESGSFIPGSSPTRICCQAALVVPERFAPELLAKFDRLRSSWTNEPELKGSAFSDDQTSKTLDLLKGHGVVVEIAAIDVAHHSVTTVKEFQCAQAEKFGAALTDEHDEIWHRFVAELDSAWMDLSPQLILQVEVLLALIEELVRVLPNFYAQRIPKELGRWDWIVDPKDVKPTRFEEVWRRTLGPILQTRSLERPMAQVRGFDYSAFDRFHMDVPEYMKSIVPADSPRPVNLGMLFTESASFADSRSETGLQLADVVASTFTKAMNGKLPTDVWRRLGPLLVQKPVGNPPATLIALGSGPRLKVEGHHHLVLAGLQSGSQPMFPRGIPVNPGRPI